MLSIHKSHAFFLAFPCKKKYADKGRLGVSNASWEHLNSVYLRRRATQFVRVKHVVAEAVLVAFEIFAVHVVGELWWFSHYLQPSNLLLEAYNSTPLSPAGQCSSASQIDITQAEVSSDLLYACLLNTLAFCPWYLTMAICHAPHLHSSTHSHTMGCSCMVVFRLVYSYWSVSIRLAEMYWTCFQNRLCSCQIPAVPQHLLLAGRLCCLLVPC